MGVINQWRIHDFPEGGAPTPKILLFCEYFAENCMKMNEFGPPGGPRIPVTPPRPDNVNIHMEVVSFK